MALASDIRDRIKSDLIINNTDYDTQILGAIQSALRQYRGKRFWFLEDFGTITTGAASNTVVLPSDFSAPSSFELLYSGCRLDDGGGFDFLTFDRLKREHWRTNPLQTTVPVACAEHGGRLYLSCISDAAYDIDVTYFKQDATLPAASETSVWFDDGYDAIRTLAQYIFKRDAQAFTPGEEDGALAEAALIALGTTHENRKAGR